MAAASVFVMELDKTNYDQHTQPTQSHINVGFGSDVTIAQLADEVAQATGYVGKISFDPSKPDGAPRKWMDSTRLNQLGWRAKVALKQGLQEAYREFLSR
jgi:GDP-L-fucose synthase